jgi:hypothetical protein
VVAEGEDVHLCPYAGVVRRQPSPVAELYCDYLTNDHFQPIWQRFAFDSE